MSTVVVLGGAGAVGRVAVRTLVKHPHFSRVIIADNNIVAANQVAQELSSPKVDTFCFDAFDPKSVIQAVQECDVVLNCVGPFYTTVQPILTGIMQAGVNYVDVNDDVDVTTNVLEMDAQVRQLGISVLIGMGNSPGVTNLLARLASETLLDRTDSVDIYHTHGGEAFEGVGVIEHRIHCMSIDIPMYLDGQIKYVSYFGEEGIALRTSFDFPLVGVTPVYPYPHPEQVTLPRYLNLKRVTNRGSVIPNPYYDLISDLCRLGLNSRVPIKVCGEQVVPYEFAIAYILRERERILQEAHFGDQRGCTSVVVKGERRGKYREYRFHMASRSQAMGEGTGIPGAMGAILMDRGLVKGPGVHPPEACVQPADFMAMLPEVLALETPQEGKASFEGFLVESVDAQGKIEKIDLPFG